MLLLEPVGDQFETAAHRLNEDGDAVQIHVGAESYSDVFPAFRVADFFATLQSFLASIN